MKKITPQSIGITMVVLGVAALIASIVENSEIPAFIGLGLTFWGAILLYIQDQDYTPTKILDASVTPTLETLNETIKAFGYEGSPVYLPPKYLKNLQDTKIFIPKQKGTTYPTPDQTQTDTLLIADPEGLLLTPPGADLVKLFEQTLATNFTLANLEYLQQNLPNLLIENLEIATKLEIEGPTTSQSLNSKNAQDGTETTHLNVTIATTPYRTLTKDQHLNSIGSPLTSAIACALAKATGQLVTITKQQTNQNGTETTIEFQLQKTEPPSP